MSSVLLGVKKACAHTNVSAVVRAAVACSPVQLTGMVWDASFPQRMQHISLPEPSKGTHPVYMSAFFAMVDAHGDCRRDRPLHDSDVCNTPVLFIVFRKSLIGCAQGRAPALARLGNRT